MSESHGYWCVKKYLSFAFFLHSTNLFFQYYAMTSTHLYFDITLCKNSQSLIKIIYSLFSRNVAMPRVLLGNILGQKGLHCFRGILLLLLLPLHCYTAADGSPLPPSLVYPQRGLDCQLKYSRLYFKMYPQLTISQLGICVLFAIWDLPID